MLLGTESESATRYLTGKLPIFNLFQTENPKLLLVNSYGYG